MNVAEYTVSEKADIDCATLGNIVPVDITEAKSAYSKLRTVSWAQRRR